MNFDDYKPVSSCQIHGLPGIYAGIFGLKTNGIFVEVGAYDGKTYSNTYQLAKLGWRGIYIEPDPIYNSACVNNHKDHPNINVLPYFISNTRMPMTVYKNADMVTGNNDFFNAFFMPDAYSTYTVETRFLDEVLFDIEDKEHFPFDFDLLVIDVEGNEMEVLGSFSLLDYWMPKVIIIEAHEYAEDERLRMHTKAINEFMDEHRYQKIYADHINSIFVPTLSEAI